MVRAALASYEAQLTTERRFSMAACADGDGRSVADIPEEELLEGFGS